MTWSGLQEEAEPGFCKFQVARALVQCSSHSPSIRESPRQTKPKKGPKRKVHEFRGHFCENSGVFP